MKRMMPFLLIIVLLLTAGCVAKQPAETNSPIPETTIPVTEEPTEPPTEPEPEPEPEPACVDMFVQVDDAPAILMLLNRGDVVDVVGEMDEDHYVIKTDSGYGLVEKQLLRMSGEPAYEVWTGYARSKAALYSGYQLTGAAVANLSLNTQLEILDELKYCYVVKSGEEIGFVRKEDVSKNFIKGGGGGNTGGADGGDISLSFGGSIPQNFGGVVMLSVIEQSGEVSGTAVVLADGTQVVLGYFQREARVPVVAEDGFAPAWEGYHTLYLDGLYAYMPQNLILLDGEEAYEPWDGFASYKAYLYDNYLLLGDGDKLNVNTVITVLYDGGDFYMVSNDGKIGYMLKDHIGTSRFVTGSTGDSEWSPPAM